MEELKSLKEGLTVKLDSNASQLVFILFSTSQCFLRWYVGPEDSRASPCHKAFYYCCCCCCCFSNQSVYPELLQVIMWLLGIVGARVLPAWCFPLISPPALSIDFLIISAWVQADPQMPTGRCDLIVLVEAGGCCWVIYGSDILI